MLMPLINHIHIHMCGGVVVELEFWVWSPHESPSVVAVLASQILSASVYVSVNNKKSPPYFFYRFLFYVNKYDFRGVPLFLELFYQTLSDKIPRQFLKSHAYFSNYTYIIVQLPRILSSSLLFFLVVLLSWNY